MQKHRCSYENCNLSFNRPYRLQQHLLVHENKKIFQCTEDGCNKSYTNNSHLIRHINSAHKKTENEYLYICQQCTNKFANRQNLKRHIKICFSRNYEYSCDICKTEYKKKNQLTAHMYQHTGIKSFCCELCSKTFITITEKKKHLRTHKTFNCIKCDISFIHWSKYRKHIKSLHAQKEFICDYCQRSFNLRVHIMRHIRSQHMKVSKSFACPYKLCSRSYLSKRNLKQHIKIYHMKIRHDCSVCNAKLCSKAGLIAHLKQHSAPVKPTPKKINTARKPRKDKGSLKVSTAIKLAGLSDFIKNSGTFNICNEVPTIH